MKPLLVLTLGVLLLSCNSMPEELHKETALPEPDRNDVCGIKARIVYLRCDAAVVQVLDPDYFHLADRHWRHPFTNIAFAYVFVLTTGYSYPWIQSLSINEGVSEPFGFVIPDKGENPRLPVCLPGPVPLPDKSHYITLCENDM